MRALPNSGKVTATPRARACYLPSNQKATILACGMKRAYETTPNKILPARIVP